jgi:hypothetical protein
LVQNQISTPDMVEFVLELKPSWLAQLFDRILGQGILTFQSNDSMLLRGVQSPHNRTPLERLGYGLIGAQSGQIIWHTCPRTYPLVALALCNALHLYALVLCLQANGGMLLHGVQTPWNRRGQ